MKDNKEREEEYTNPYKEDSNEKWYGQGSDDWDKDWEDSWFEDDWNDINSMASTNDLTGLIPTPPKDNKESKSYTDIYDIPKPAEEDPSQIEKRADKPKN